MLNKSLIGLLSVSLSLLAVYVWQSGHHQDWENGIVASNGRLEAVEIDLAAKYGGRVTDVTAHEGEAVKAGQLLVRLDTTELEAELRLAQAEQLRAEQGRHVAEEQVAMAASDQAFAF